MGAILARTVRTPGGCVRATVFILGRLCEEGKLRLRPMQGPVAMRAELGSEPPPLCVLPPSPASTLSQCLRPWASVSPSSTDIFPSWWPSNGVGCTWIWGEDEG